MTMIQQTITCDGCGIAKGPSVSMAPIIAGPLPIHHAHSLVCLAKVLRQLAPEVDALEAKRVADEAAKAKRAAPAAQVAKIPPAPAPKAGSAT
jgi:hypothetical protein